MHCLPVCALRAGRSTRQDDRELLRRRGGGVAAAWRQHEEELLRGGCEMAQVALAHKEADAAAVDRDRQLREVACLRRAVAKVIVALRRWGATGVSGAARALRASGSCAGGRSVSWAQLSGGGP